EATLVATEGELVAQLAPRIREARADIEPQRSPGLIADAIAVGHRLEREQKAPSLDGGLEIGHAELVVHDRGMPGEIEVAVEVCVDPQLVDGPREVELEHDGALGLVDLRLLKEQQ